MTKIKAEIEVRACDECGRQSQVYPCPHCWKDYCIFCADVEMSRVRPRDSHGYMRENHIILCKKGQQRLKKTLQETEN